MFILINSPNYIRFIACYGTRIKQDINCSHSTPELQTHFGPASECEGAEKDEEEDEEEAEFVPVLASNSDDPVTTADNTLPTTSTLNSTHSLESQRSHNPLGVQLGRLKLETNRYERSGNYLLQNHKMRLLQACSYEWNV